MKIIGIIAEYNPFHNGHLFHIQEARRLAAADAVICAISGNFVQRGEPSIFDKWARAKMALTHGADLVLEIPCLYATRSAYWFAWGGIDVLQKTGITTHLAFGAENSDLKELAKASHLLAHESPSFQDVLKKALKKGYSYPRARAEALRSELPGSSIIWEEPNNILALTYLQIIMQRNLSLQPILIKRIGAGYHEKSLNHNTPSASAIRFFLEENSHLAPACLEHLATFLPEGVSQILLQEISCGRGPVFTSSLSPTLLTLLRRSEAEDVRKIIDIKEGLENRILAAAEKALNWYDFLSIIKTKRFTYTRLQRFLIHYLLNYTIDKEPYLLQGSPYLRVLGFSKDGRNLLQKINGASPVPIITKGAHSRKYLRNKHFSSFWQMDVRATNIYSLFYPNNLNSTGNADYFRSPVYNHFDG